MKTLIATSAIALALIVPAAANGMPPELIGKWESVSTDYYLALNVSPNKYFSPGEECKVTSVKKTEQQETYNLNVTCSVERADMGPPYKTKVTWSVQHLDIGKEKQTLLVTVSPDYNEVVSLWKKAEQ